MIQRRDCLRALAGGTLVGMAGCLANSGSESATEQRSPARKETETATETAQPTDTQSPVPPGTVRKLTPANGGEMYQFGIGVAFDGDRALIGARSAANESGTRTGTAYVYKRSDTEWNEEAVLAAADGFSGHEFGQAVALSGDLAAVGTRTYEQGRAIYVFERSGSSWSQRGKLNNEIVDGDGVFGEGFAVHGDRIAVGGRRDGRRVVNLYSLVEGTLHEDGMVKAPVEAELNAFGQSLAMTDQRLLVGAPAPIGTDEQVADVAYLYRYRDDDWVREARFRPVDTADPSRFGADVALTEGVAAIGSTREHPNGSLSGAGYVFEQDSDSWQLSEKVVPADGAAGDMFGTAVAASPETVVFGVHRDETAHGTNAGSAYVYGRESSGWKLVEKLVPEDGDQEDKFGVAVDVAGRTVIVGAFLDDDWLGSAYVFQL